MVAIVIAIAAYFHTGVVKAVTTFGTAVACGGNTTCLNGDLGITGAFTLGGPSPSTSLQIQAVRQTFTAAGFVACAIQNPFSATSSISHFFYSANATSSAQTLAVGTSTSATATTTSMFAPVIGANSNATASWSGGSNNDQIGTGQWIVVGYAGTNIPLGGSFDTGSCGAIFTSDN